MARKFSLKKPGVVTPPPVSQQPQKLAAQPEQPKRHVVVEKKDVPALPEDPKQEIIIQRREKILDTKALQQKAAQAVKESPLSYDEETTYTGIVNEVRAGKGSCKNIFIVDGPHGPVQIYDNTVGVSTRKMLSTGAKVSFSPLIMESPQGPYVNGVEVTVLEINQANSMLQSIQEKFAGLAFLVPSADILGMIPTNAQDVDQTIAELNGQVAGEIIAYHGNSDVFVIFR